MREGAIAPLASTDCCPRCPAWLKRHPAAVANATAKRAIPAAIREVRKRNLSSGRFGLVHRIVVRLTCYNVVGGAIVLPNGERTFMRLSSCEENSYGCVFRSETHLCAVIRGRRLSKSGTNLP